MTPNVVSVIKNTIMVGFAALVVSTPLVAQERSDVLERIKPIGQVTIGKAAQEPAKSAAPAAAQAAAPADPGAALFKAKGCPACHGAEGRAPVMSTYPKLAALPEQYIHNQLKDIKSGARSNGQTAVMKGIMAAVSDEDMKVLAAWLSGLPRNAEAAAAGPAAAKPAAAPSAAASDPGADLFTAKGCTGCHGVDGKAPIMSTYPKLAGLPAPYIVNQMKDIKSGARSNGQTAVMKGVLGSVTEDDMKAIAAWLTKIPR